VLKSSLLKYVADFLGLAENGQIDDRFDLLLQRVWKVFKVAVCRQPVKKSAKNGQKRFYCRRLND